MKKLIIILIAAMSFGAASAQSRDSYRRQDRDQTSGYYENIQQGNTYAYNNYDRDNDRNRQEAYDRKNQQYDQREGLHRNDRSFSRRQRDQKIREAERERQLPTRTSGTGVIAAGVAGLVIGLLIGHK